MTNMSKDNNLREPRNHHCYLFLMSEDKYIIEIEKYCKHFSFEDSIIAFREVDENRWSAILLESSGDYFIAQIKAFPSNIVQSRIELDVLCAMDLSKLKPTSIQKLSKLKRELILIINTK